MPYLAEDHNKHIFDHKIRVSSANAVNLDDIDL